MGVTSESDPLKTTLLRALRNSLRLQPVPLVVAESIWPAAALWAGGITVEKALRRARILPGDRIVARLPNGAAFIQLMLGCLRVGAGFCPVPIAVGSSDASDYARDLGAVLVIEHETDFADLRTLGNDAASDEVMSALECSVAETILLWRGRSVDESPVAISIGDLLSEAEARSTRIGLTEDSTLRCPESWATQSGLTEVLAGLLSPVVIEAASASISGPSPLTTAA